MLAIWGRYRKSSTADLLITLASAVVIAFVVQLWFVKPYRIPSPSMVPTLELSDRIIVVRFLYHFTDPKRGDIIVFHPNGVGSKVFLAPTASSQNYVKRLIGLPGEWIGASNERVYICGQQAPAALDTPADTPGCRYLNEPYTHGKPTDSFGPVKLGPKDYFMMGDNRTDSEDSRFWGQIKEKQIIGRSFVTYWPLDRISFY